MSATSERVRSGRSGRGRLPVVAVTGAGSPAGRAVAAGLARARDAGRLRDVLAVDAAERLPDGADRDGADRDGVRWLAADPGTPGVREALTGADVVVHVAHTADEAAQAHGTATARRARAVRSVQEVAGAAAAEGAHRLVVVSSAAVYGAVAGGPVPLAEDAPLAAERGEGVVGDLLEVERIVARLPKVHPALRTTVIRPAVLAGPGVDTMFTRHLRATRLLALRGEQMLWQFCHVDDLAEAVAIAVEHELDGVLTAGGQPWLTDNDVERLTGMRRVELPARFAFAAAERLRRTGTVTTPAGDLAFVVHPWVVGADRLRAAGWRPQHSAAGCLREVREPQGAGVPQDGARQEGPGGRRMEGREAALGAAGAAVAILGTAALLRQARARRAGRPRPRL